jgi:hypothetical protein
VIISYSNLYMQLRSVDKVESIDPEAFKKNYYEPKNPACDYRAFEGLGGISKMGLGLF